MGRKGPTNVVLLEVYQPIAAFRSKSFSIGYYNFMSKLGLFYNRDNRMPKYLFFYVNQFYFLRRTRGLTTVSDDCACRYGRNAFVSHLENETKVIFQPSYPKSAR